VALRGPFHSVESFDGTRLAWTSAGAGEPAVVLANGIFCTDTYWTFLVPHLVDQGHRVVLWDYRGHGRSEPPANPNEVTVGAHARDLWCVADAAGVDRAVLVGHSMGVQTILEAYREAPSRVAGLVAIAGAYEHPDRTFYGWPWLHHLLPFLELSVTPVPAVTRAAWRALTDQRDLLYWSGRAGGMIGGRASRQLMSEYFAHLGTLDPLLAYRMVRAMGDHTARDLLPRIDVPTLVLAGGRDVMTPPQLAERMADAIPGARLELLGHGSHTLPIDDPELVDDLVAEFVDGLEDGDGRPAGAGAVPSAPSS
jgi:pimeloyl-ACP methyl ester carboxylesterase